MATREPSEKDLLRRITRNADQLDAANVLYDERLALFRAARAREVPIRYEVIAAAARLSQAAVFKAIREAVRAGR